MEDALIVEPRLFEFSQVPEGVDLHFIFRNFRLNIASVSFLLTKFLSGKNWSMAGSRSLQSSGA